MLQHLAEHWQRIAQQLRFFNAPRWSEDDRFEIS
jgi:hypothetical protein